MKNNAFPPHALPVADQASSLKILSFSKDQQGIQDWLNYLSKVKTPIHDNIRELVTWECKEHGVKS
jgi:hypothetical protein